MKPERQSNVASEPVAGSAPAPLFLMIGVGVLLYWAMWHLNENSGNFRANVYAPFKSAAEVDRANPKSPEEAQRELGMAVFARYCAQCHQASGLGSPGQYPPLAGSDWVQMPGADRLIRLVLHGMQGPVTVSGKEFNNAMPTWRDTLTDEQIAAVLTFVRGNAEWGNQAAAVGTNRVAEIRKNEPTRDAPWLAEELLKTPVGEAAATKTAEAKAPEK